MDRCNTFQDHYDTISYEGQRPNVDGNVYQDIDDIEPEVPELLLLK